MKYIFEPNVTVIDYENNRKKFQFDYKGEFETENEKLIKWIAKNKSFMKPINNFKCKKCDFQTDNQGLLLSHYKKEHPKEG